MTVTRALVEDMHKNIGIKTSKKEEKNRQAGKALSTRV
jgi:hypothetical protein